MTWFIEINKLNGRNDFYTIVSRISANGFGDRVEYSDGGWEDRCPSVILPHLKFECSDDAVAYSLAFGGEILGHPPTREDT